MKKRQPPEHGKHAPETRTGNTHQDHRMARSGHHLRSKRSAPSTRRLPAWLALLSLVAQLLVPFGQALALDPIQDIEYQVICTASGVKQIAVDTDGNPILPQNAAPCPFCFSHAAPSVLQPEVGSVFVKHAPDVVVSFARLENDQHASLWHGVAHPSRAPPQSL